MTNEYKIGQQYYSTGKNKHLCTVVDILKTYNKDGVLVKIRYVSVHEFCGQMVKDNDVVAVTIARGLTKGGL